MDPRPPLGNRSARGLLDEGRRPARSPGEAAAAAAAAATAQHCSFIMLADLLLNAVALGAAGRASDSPSPWMGFLSARRYCLLLLVVLSLSLLLSCCCVCCEGGSIFQRS